MATRSHTARWQIWIDTGGTFTDGVAISPSGELCQVKILSTGALRGRIVRALANGRYEIDPGWDAPGAVVRGLAFRRLGDTSAAPARVARYDERAGVLEVEPAAPAGVPAGAAFELVSGEEAPLLAARLLTRTAPSLPLPAARLRLATTLGTNALLERRGVPTVLFVTRGFGDLLRIGNQQRPELFRLDVRRPAPLYDAVVEVDERLDAAGVVLRALDADALAPRAAELLARGVGSAAVALLHAYRNPAHELELARRLREWGFDHVSCSSELAPRIRLLPRAQTAVVDAYLAPVVRTYLDRVAAPLPQGDLLVMTSAGGLLDAASYRPKDSLLSGPAGGVVGAARAGRRAGFARIISFDMGGTSTDVARIDGDYEYCYEHRVGDAELVAPALAIETVAAGGGSVCWLDGERLRVGPHSAGASPGPACYGAGGPLTLTDVNLLLGYLEASRFDIPVDVEPARRRFDELREALQRSTGERPDPLSLLEGLLAIADETMADAIRRISLRRGYDPADYVLVAFGGAGGQHACGVAERLGIARIVVPPAAALLSAHGLGHAVLERFVERQVLQPLARAAPRVGDWLDELERRARRAVADVGVPAQQIEVRRRTLHLRFVGQDATLEVDFVPGHDPREQFERAHAELFGHRPEDRAVELESIRVVASSRPPTDHVARDWAAYAHAARPAPAGEPSTLERATLDDGRHVPGPAVVLEPHSATLVRRQWSVRALADGSLFLARDGDATRAADSGRPEAIRLELFTQRFTRVVQEMGERLERTAVSTNVKERLDFSCALLDPRGELVVNAPHIPVHLGALGLCVRRVAGALTLRPGDVVVTNHPAFGGSHLPDVTVITPVFADDEHLLGYLASRAHHAEIGGSRPGSMPPAATRLAEEGVVIPPLRVIERGAPRWAALRERLRAGPWPSRAVEDNLADVRAAVAANHAGAGLLRRLVGRHGSQTVLLYMERLERLADERIRAALRALGDGVFEAEERLDDGTPLHARIEIADGRATVDFAGSGAVHPGNLNATPAIVRSAVIYVMRLLLREPLPLNEGLLRAVAIRVPPGLLNPPFGDDPSTSPAVVGGNVETSQRLVDTLLKALGLAACSQGTMNNLIFGNARYGYYETLGGGCGAGPGFEGASAVHSHMTNTRITDPEVIEHRYPVRLERFCVRRGSGGEGRHRGGDGLVRELTFLEPAELSVLTQHRTVAPYGLAGGRPGARGTQRVVRAADRTVQQLDSIDGCHVAVGDRVIVETPGGGGYGEPS